MKNTHGFSLVEVLIVVAIIAILGAIAVPSLLTSRQAANEAAAMQGCRTIGSAEISYAATNNQQYTDLAHLVSGEYLDSQVRHSWGNQRLHLRPRGRCRNHGSMATHPRRSGLSRRYRRQRAVCLFHRTRPGGAISGSGSGRGAPRRGCCRRFRWQAN